VNEPRGTNIHLAHWQHRLQNITRTRLVNRCSARWQRAHAVAHLHCSHRGQSRLRRHDAFICVLWRICMCSMTRAYMWLVQTWRDILRCSHCVRIEAHRECADMTHLYAMCRSRVSGVFICAMMHWYVPWLNATTHSSHVTCHSRVRGVTHCCDTLLSCTAVSTAIAHALWHDRESSSFPEIDCSFARNSSLSYMAPSPKNKNSFCENTGLFCENTGSFTGIQGSFAHTSRRSLMAPALSDFSIVFATGDHSQKSAHSQTHNITWL